MKAFITSAAILASVVAAQRPTNESICDYYTTALLKDNNATNQETLLTLVVNTAVIGNYTQPNVGIVVPGILTPGTYNGESVNLAPYFSGGLLSTNDGGMSGVSVNFLDGGGAAPLMMNMPANSTSSAQYDLLTHLYKYFAYLLGCSQYGNTTMQYDGDTNMYQVHKFMDIGAAEIGYFITQVGLSAASFGVADADVTVVGNALNKTFGYRCSPNASVPASAPAAPQAICIASDCPQSPNPDCSLYAAAVEPGNATSSDMNATSSSGASGSTSATASASSAGASGSGAATGSASGSGASASASPSTQASTGDGQSNYVVNTLALAIAMGLAVLLN